MHLLLTAWLVLTALIAPAQAATPGPVWERSPDTAWKSKSKEEKEEEMSAAEKEADRKKKEKLARVIVLKWPQTSTDYTDQTVQRNVKSRVARPDAQFFPEVDLYQNGRKVRDKTVVPAMQPAAVPDQNLQRVRQAVAEVSGVPWNAMQPANWGIKAQELREMVELIWFIDKVEQREPLFLLYAQIGRSAENQLQNIPPFFEQIGNIPVNYYFYLAALLAYQDPALMSKLTDQDLNAQIGVILQQLQQAAYPNLRIDFELEDEDFDLAQFGESYEVYINGLKTDPSEEGQIDIFLGRTDIYLKRVDSGHGLSERLEVTKLEDKIYFVRDAARKKMGNSFIEQLFLHPNECTPALDGDIINYLAIYAKIHEKAEIYIAVPKEGNPNKVWIWRYDRPSANLQLVSGGNEGFPVRFALLVHVGILYNDAAVEYDIDPETPPSSDSTDPLGDLATNNFDSDVSLNPAYIPLDFELRAHYNRLMLSVGAEAGFNTGGPDGDAKWIERYHTRGNPYADVAELTEELVTEGVDGNGDGDYEDTEDTAEEYRLIGRELLYNELMINRNLYLGVAAVLGRDAGIGFGPRIGMRIGWTNVPYALQTTGHVGLTLPAPIIKPLGDRVRPLVDIEGRAGASWPFFTSLAFDPGDTGALVTVAPVFGITGGLGFTF